MIWIAQQNVVIGGAKVSSEAKGLATSEAKGPANIDI